MLNFKKLASTFIFSILAFQSTACAVPRYAKVVLLGGKGSGKTTIQKLINKDYDINNIPHTTQISYISVPVFYDNKGNFTFDEDRDVQRYNKEVILNICDIPSANDIDYDYNTEEYKKQAENNEKILKCVDEFALKKPTIIVALADGNHFENSDDWGLYIDGSFSRHLQNLDFKLSKFVSFNEEPYNKEGDECRKIVILTHEDTCNFEDMNAQERENLGGHEVERILIKESVIGYLKGFFKEIPNFDVVKVLTLYDSKIKKENKHTKTEKKLVTNDSKLTINNEINLEYISNTEEVFDKSNKEDLQKYVNVILNSIARSVYKYGINNLPLDSNNSDWTIIDGKLVKGH